MGEESRIESATARIAERLGDVRARVARACERSGRDAAEVRVIGVTKTFPPEVVTAAAQAGLLDIGENRVQELDEKVTALAATPIVSKISWHLVGSLQRNKARRAVELAHEFHALDSVRLARELDRRAAAAERVLSCYVQVNVSGEASKSGVTPEQTHAFLDSLASFGHLHIVGLMTLAAPASSDNELEAIVRPQLRRLAELARTYDPLDDSTCRRPLRLSMGMSGDYEVAVEEGATDIRLGTALFGER